MHILVVEDDPVIARAVTQAFDSDDGVQVEQASSIENTLVQLAWADMVLLDLNLPDSQGAGTLERVRQVAPQIPLIVISAIDVPDVRIQSLYRGADDYLTKPFAIDELRARIDAVTRRTIRPRPPDPEGLSWHPRARQLQWHGQPIDLTPLEQEIFRVFAENPGVSLSRPDILRRVVGPNFYGYERVVDVHVGHLRRKLAAVGTDVVQTVRAHGYRWNPDIPVDIADA